MIRYNNISRPVHDPHDPSPRPHDPLHKISGARPQSPGLTPLHPLYISKPFKSMPMVSGQFFHGLPPPFFPERSNFSNGYTYFSLIHTNPMSHQFQCSLYSIYPSTLVRFH